MDDTLIDRIIELSGKLAVAEFRLSNARAEIDTMKTGPIVAPRDVLEMLAAMRDGKKIEAIKYCRTLTGYGLKESKDLIESAWPSREAA